jgi:RHS repeat-associated protein
MIIGWNSPSGEFLHYNPTSNFQLLTSNFQYARGPSGNLFSTENANKFYYYTTDGLGSVTAITDQTGTLLDEYKYDEFGMLTNVDEKSNINNPFKFTGAIHDKTANLYLMGSRYYNPKVGRFITQDSFGATFGADWTDHLYSYTGNNPVNFIDPTGHVYLSPNASRNSMQDTFNVQNMLIQLNILKNYSPGGKYDSKTVQAVNTFKSRYGLGNNGNYRGVVGNQTYEYLLKATSGKLKSPSQGTSNLKPAVNNGTLIKLTESDARKNAFQKTIADPNVQVTLAKHGLDGTVEVAYKDAKKKFITWALNETAEKGPKKVVGKFVPYWNVIDAGRDITNIVGIYQDYEDMNKVYESNLKGEMKNVNWVPPDPYKCLR